MQIYFTVSIGPSHMESYMGFSQAPQTLLPSPITPQHPDGASLYFAKEARPSVASLPKDTQFPFWRKIPFLKIFPPLLNLPKCTSSFNRP